MVDTLVNLRYLLLSCSDVSDSLKPFQLQLVRLLCPWDFSGKNTRVDCPFLLQGIFLNQESNPDLLYSTWSPALQADSVPTEPPGKPKIFWLSHKNIHIFLLLCEEGSEMAWDSFDFFFPTIVYHGWESQQKKIYLWLKHTLFHVSEHFLGVSVRPWGHLFAFSSVQTSCPPQNLLLQTKLSKWTK